LDFGFWIEGFRTFARSLLILRVENISLFMIKSFASKETEQVFKRKFSRKLPQDIQRNARRKLEILDAAETLQDLYIPPSNRLEKLSGGRKISIVSELTISGGSVLFGKLATPTM
jgi:proteic killer suppression protein